MAHSRVSKQGQRIGERRHLQAEPTLAPTVATPADAALKPPLHFNGLLPLVSSTSRLLVGFTDADTILKANAARMKRWCVRCARVLLHPGQHNS